MLKGQTMFRHIFLSILLLCTLLSADEITKDSVGRLTLLPAQTADEITTAEEAFAVVDAAQKALLDTMRTTKSAAEAVQHYRKAGETALPAAEKAIALSGDSKKDLEKAYQAKLTALQQLLNADLLERKTESLYFEQIDKLLKELEEKQLLSATVRNSRFRLFLQKDLQDLTKNFSQDKLTAVLDKAKEFSKQKAGGNSTQVLLSIANAAVSAEVAEIDPQAGIQTLDALTAFLNSPDFTGTDAEKEATVKRWDGLKRRLGGSSLKLSGKTLDDADFDWNALRGKYVIVKFTATWCGPCKGELPGLHSAYEKYKDKGLEIVSVYIWERDKDLDKAAENIKNTVEKEKVDWLVISEPLSEKAGQPKIGDYYGISGVPTMLLIDKDGKIIDTEARGQHLQDRLTEIFGK